MLDGFVQSIVLDYPIGLALSLSGFTFWVCAE
jgi:hypothetical protein